MDLKIFRCKKCGKVVAMLKGSACDTLCCDEAMSELVANTTEAAVEKHVPVAVKNGNLVEVTVGSVAHPMEEKHFIEWIAIVSNDGCQLKTLAAGEEPKASFALKDGDDLQRTYAYCNLHGLWATK